MPRTTSCPACLKRFGMKPELIGKRVKCPACKQPFTAEADEELKVAPPPPTVAPPAMRTSAPRPAVLPPRSTRAASVAASGDGESPGVFKFGVSVTIFGGLTLILPLFGLQFKKVQDSGADSVYVGIGLIIAGVVICVLAKMGVWGKRLIYAALLLPVAVILIGFGVVYFNYWNRQRLAHRSTPAPTPMVPVPRPGVQPVRPPPSAPPVTYESMVQKYGADQVVRVNVLAPLTMANQRPALYKELAAAFRANGAKQQRSSAKGDRIEFAAAPITDLDALVKQISPGKKSIVSDPATRTIEVEVAPTAATQP